MTKQSDPRGPHYGKPCGDFILTISSLVVIKCLLNEEEEDEEEEEEGDDDQKFVIIPDYEVSSISFSKGVRCACVFVCVMSILHNTFLYMCIKYD